MGANFDKWNNNISMEDIYRFEDNEELLKFCYRDTGVPMWMFIRSPLIRETIRILLGDDYAIQKNKRNVSKKGRHCFDRYLRRNPFFTGKKDVIFAFFLDECLTQHEDGFYDELIMPCIKLLMTKTSTIMSGEAVGTKDFKCDHVNWRADSCFYDLLSLRTKNEICQADRENINGLLNYVFRFYPIKIDKQTKKRIRDKLHYIALYHKKMIDICALYLSIVRPKLVFISHGSYQLPFNSALIFACKKCKITTAEFQHAWVGKIHENFNYGNLIIKDKRCRIIMPDYLLTMGSFWKSQINVPQKVRLIGYMKQKMRDTVPQNDNILFAASNKYTQYEELLNELLPQLDKSSKIYFRLHPAEFSPSLLSRFQKYTSFGNFNVANEHDLSFYMKKCRYVIVDGSTVCYEALYFGRIVFGLNNSLCKLYEIDKISAVKTFVTADEFLELWDRRNQYMSVRHKEFFEENWKKNFINFLNEQGVKISLRKEKER